MELDEQQIYDRATHNDFTRQQISRQSTIQAALKEVKERAGNFFEKRIYPTTNPPFSVAEFQMHLLSRIGDVKCNGQSFCVMARTKEREQCIQSASVRVRQLFETISCAGKLQDEIFGLVDQTIAECPNPQELVAVTWEHVLFCGN